MDSLVPMPGHLQNPLSKDTPGLINIEREMESLISDS